jgi:hypothetical protein
MAEVDEGCSECTEHEECVGCWVTRWDWEAFAEGEHENDDV